MHCLEKPYERLNVYIFLKRVEGKSGSTSKVGLAPIRNVKVVNPRAQVINDNNATVFPFRVSLPLQSNFVKI